MYARCALQDATWKQSFLGKIPDFQRVEDTTMYDPNMARY